jgi:hypothetical protein
MLVDEPARAIDPQIVPVRKQGDETLEVDLAKQMFVAVTGSLALERDRGAGEKNRVGCEGPVVLAKGAPALHLGCGLPVHRKHILQTRLGCCSDRSPTALRVIPRDAPGADRRDGFPALLAQGGRWLRAIVRMNANPRSALAIEDRLPGRRLA